MVKRETTPTSDSAQFILAWRSEEPSQAMVAALFQKRLKKAEAKTPARGQYPKKRKTMRRGRHRKKKPMGVREIGCDKAVNYTPKNGSDGSRRRRK